MRMNTQTHTQTHTHTVELMTNEDAAAHFEYQRDGVLACQRDLLQPVQ